MFVVMGAAGHIGSVVVDTLVDQGHGVLALVHTPDKEAGLKARGARTAVVDVHDVEALRAAFSLGRRAFLLNPPADPSGDTDREELRTVAAILKALEGSDLEKVVAASTMGARPGERLGDLNTLFALEQGLADQPIPAAVNRGAYYFTNWDMMLDGAQDGVLPSMYPPNFALPMVSPTDLGLAAARRLTSSVDDVGIIEVEGPARYTPADVAEAFSRALDRPVQVETTSPDRFEATYATLGFSAAAAASYARMTGETLKGDFASAAETHKGTVTLDQHVRSLVSS